MPSNCTLIEFKLRRYFYLGHEYSLYVPPNIRRTVNLEHNYEDITGIRIIRKIIEKNKAEEINSIVPIIIKIKKENMLYDDKLLIFILAVCTRFQSKQCSKMMVDAYAAISEVCTDGLKLLMFVKFCRDINKILHNEGCLPILPYSFGSGFRNAINKWYLRQDPLFVTEMIVKSKCYAGMSHKIVMNLMRTESNDPSRNVFITYAKKGMVRVEQLFASKFNDLISKNYKDTLENIEFVFVYNYLEQVNNMKKMNAKQLRSDIEFNRWGKMYEIVPRKMLKDYFVLTALVSHIPLRKLLDNTCLFAKLRLFNTDSSEQGLWEFILRFNNSFELEKQRIHPFESYIEYTKYSRNYKKIIAMQKSKCIKQGYQNVESIKNRLTINFEDESFCNDQINFQITDITNDTTTDTCQNKVNTTQSTVENVCASLQARGCPLNTNIDNKQRNQNSEQSNPTVSSVKNNRKSKLETEVEVQSEIGYINPCKPKNMLLLRPPARLNDKILKFLSEDLLEKTLKKLKPTNRRIIIVYDNRDYMKDFACSYADLLSASEAVTLISLSLIKPEKLNNKPTICCLNSTLQTSKIKIEYNDALTFNKLHSIMFGALPNEPNAFNKKLKADPLNVLSVMNWAKEKNEKYDVFIFLGTSKMNLTNIQKSRMEYQKFSKKPVKIITCCLSGKHSTQVNLSKCNMLFIQGFDKNVGKIIYSFINEEF